MRKLTLSLAVMAALTPARGYPLGLGEIELNSALNQELNAEIEVLSAAPEDAEQLIVKLADRDAFSRAGIDRPFLLQQLKFKVIEKNGEPLIKVYTTAPIREPYLNFLLEIDWPKGHLLREYTLLLDPPIYNTGVSSSPASSEAAHPFIEPADTQAQTQPAYPSQPVAQPAPAQVVSQPAATTGANQTGTISSDSGRSMDYQYRPMPQAVAAPDQYRVQKSDTLWSIASRMRPDSSVSVEQMMLALVKKNPEAFINENINGVKRGYILRMPSRDEATRLDRQQALAQAREHASLWREYRQTSASAAPATSREEAAEPTAASSGTASSTADGKLSIMGASEAEASEFAGANQDPNSELTRLKQELALAREQLESAELEKEDLQSRLSELEQRVKRVIEMGDDELAKLQQDLEQSESAEQAAMESAPAEAVAEEVPAESAEVMPEEAAAEQLPGEEMPEEPVAEETAPAEESVFVDESEPPADVAEAEMPAQQSQPVQPAQPPAFAQKKPRDFFSSLLDDPKLLGMIGGGLAFIFLLVALLVRRLRGNKSDEPQEWDSALSDDFSDLSSFDETVETHAKELNETTEMLASEAVAGGQVDTSQGSALDMQGSAEESDDVLVGVETYLQYGIFDQAEELLKEAIEQNPERDDYRMKLLETYYAARNAPAFEQLAQEVHERKGNDQTYWGRVATMGAELCPASSLFAGAAATAGAADALTTDMADLDLGTAPETTEDLSLGDLDLGEPGADDSQLMTEPLDLGEETGQEMDLAGELESLTGEFGAIESEPDVSSDLDLGEAESGGDELDLDEDFSLDFEASDLGLEEASDEPAAAEDDLSLGEDLDLGLDMEEPGASTGDDSLEMDLTDELGDFSLDETETPEPAPDESGLGEDLGDDFGLDFDIDEPSEPAGTEETGGLELDLGEDLGLDMEDTEAELDLGMDEGLSLDMDEPELDLSEAELGMGEAELDMGEAELDLDESELDLDESELNMGEPELDMGDFSLDLDEPAAEPASDELDVGMDLGDESDFDLSELSEDVDEVSTKLDLARAYIDMGDNEGARSILEEVKVEGNSEQQQQADELLRQAS